MMQLTSSIALLMRSAVVFASAVVVLRRTTANSCLGLILLFRRRLRAARSDRAKNHTVLGSVLWNVQRLFGPLQELVGAPERALFR